MGAVVIVEVPTAFIGTTQSGKTWRAVRTWEIHNGPAIFADVQWRLDEYSKVPHVTASSVEEIVASLSGWDGSGPAPKIAWRVEVGDYARDLGRLFDYVFSVHRARHLEGRFRPTLGLFLDEVSLAADNSARPDNPAVRVFTGGYQHGIVGVALTQRPAQTSRHILGNCWEYVLFALAPPDVRTLREDYGLVLPDPAWVGDPEAHHYYRLAKGKWLRGDEAGTEVPVDALPAMQGEGEDALPEGPQSGDREGDDEGDGQGGMPPLQKGIQPPSG